MAIVPPAASTVTSLAAGMRGPYRADGRPLPAPAADRAPVAGPLRIGATPRRARATAERGAIRATFPAPSAHASPFGSTALPPRPRPTRTGRPVRPRIRARRLRRRVRRAAERRTEPRDGPAGDHRPREPGAPRRGRRRPEHRRRRRDAAAAARRAAARRHRRRPPARRPVRRRGLLPPAGGGAPPRAGAAAGRDRRGRGPARRHLARHPGREGLRRHHRQLVRAVHQAARRGRRRRTSRATRTRSSASST